jgi:hypothetical protein
MLIAVIREGRRTMPSGPTPHIDAGGASRDRAPCAMADFPTSVREFRRMFPNDAACAEHLAKTRWPGGFICRGCGGREAWRIPSRKVLTFACKACRKETSVTAGTIMHRSHLPLQTWFWAAFLIAARSDSISALQLQRELGVGSYKSAWLLEAKLRKVMGRSHAAPRPGRQSLGPRQEEPTRGRAPPGPRARGGRRRGT